MNETIVLVYEFPKGVNDTVGDVDVFSSGKLKQSSFFLLFLGGCISAIERPVREEVHRNRSTLNNPNCPVDSQWERGLSVAMTRSAR